MLQAAEAEWQAAVGAIFSLALTGDERCQTIIGRLGEDHSAVITYRKIDAAREALYAECSRRYSGDAVPFPSMWMTFLLVRA